MRKKEEEEKGPAESQGRDGGRDGVERETKYGSIKMEMEEDRIGSFLSSSSSSSSSSIPSFIPNIYLKNKNQRK